MRMRLRLLLGLVLILVAVVAVRAERGKPVEAVAVAQVGGDDAGDERASTSYDGAMVRKRTAIAIHPVAGADRANITRELRSLADGAKLAPLTPATFAVFSKQMLDYLVPEMTFVLPEGATVEAGEAFMRDHQPADVAFYLVEPVLVHDLTFAVVPAAGVAPATVRAVADREGILADSLNHYVTTVQPAGLTVRYFGAILSDAQIGAVRDALGRAAQVPADRVQVEATESGPGVELSGGVPNLEDAPHTHH